MAPLFIGVALELLGVPALLIANAHQPEYDCAGSSVAACEQAQASLTPVPGRFSEGTYELVHAAGFGLVALGIGLIFVGVILVARPRGAAT